MPLFKNMFYWSDDAFSYTKQYLYNFILPYTLTSSISKHAAKGCQGNKSVGWKWTSLMQVQIIIHLICVFMTSPMILSPSSKFGWNIFLMLFSPFYCLSCTAWFTTLYVPQPILLLCITCGSLGSIADRLKYFEMLSSINLQHPRFESYCAAVCINICSEHARLFFLPHTEF